MGVFLTFLYIFNFTIIKGVRLSESSIAVFVILFIACLVNRECNKNTFRLAQSLYNKRIFKLLMLCIVIAAVVPVVQFTFDFSYLLTLLHQFIVIFTGFLLVAYFKWSNIPIFESILKAFFIQSLIQFTCFISPAFMRLTDIFRPDEIIELRNRSYRGFRGLAISGSGYFGLAAAYAILFVALAFYLDKWKKPILLKILVMFSLLFGAISAGRTALIGVVLFALIYAFRMLKKLNTRTLRNTVAVFLIVLIGFLALRGPITNYLRNNQTWFYMRYYLFEFLENDTTNQGASLENITSLTHMFRDMYFKLSPKQILFGYGRFTDPDGRFYMHTDVGLMRNLLYFGIFGTIVLYYYHIKTLFYNAYDRPKRIVAYFLLLISMVLEIKGQTMGFLIITQSMLLMICSDYDEITKETDEQCPALV